MAEVVPYEPSHLPQLQKLINGHLGAVMPGWALPAGFIADRLTRDPEQYVTDPWVTERKTLCGMERGRVCAAAHLLRYSGPQDNPHYRNAADVAWFVAWPDSGGAAEAILGAVRRQVLDWGVDRTGLSHGMPGAICYGIADSWPHIAGYLNDAGCVLTPGCVDTLYAGPLTGIEPPGDAPAQEVYLQRGIAITEASFFAMVNGEEIAHCEVVADMTLGGELPALAGWSELSSLLLDEEWRNRGVGTWLVRHAVAWLRLAGRERIVVAVAEEDERAGAGRFYRRFGWQPVTRLDKGWSLPLPGA